MNRTHRTAAAALVAAFTVVIDNTKVNVALPTLAEAFAVDETTLQWIVESYVLAFAALLLLGGAVADWFGPAATMRAGLVVFAAGSAAAAAAPSAGALVAARVLTGLAAALVMPATLAAVVSAPDDRSRGVAGWTGVVALGVAVGPLVGGRCWWPRRGPRCSGSTCRSRSARPSRCRARRGPRHPPRGSTYGAARCSPASCSAWSRRSPRPRGTPGWSSRRAPVRRSAPWPTRATSAGASRCCPWRSSGRRLRTAVGALSAMFGAIFGIAFLLPQYLRVVRGVGPFGTGLYVLAYALALVVSAMAAGTVPRRHRRLLVTSGLLGAAAVHALAAFGLGPTTSPWALAAGLAVVGLGIGAAQTPLTEALLAAVGPRTGLGSALNDAVREVGGVVGVAVLGSLAVAVAGPPATGPALLDGMRVAFAVAAVVLGLAAVTTARSAGATAATAPGAPAAHR